MICRLICVFDKNDCSTAIPFTIKLYSIVLRDFGFFSLLSGAEIACIDVSLSK